MSRLLAIPTALVNASASKEILNLLASISFLQGIHKLQPLAVVRFCLFGVSNLSLAVDQSLFWTTDVQLATSGGM